MIRVYCSIQKCARNLHSLKKLKQDTGFISSLKNYSVSLNKEAESVAIKSNIKGLSDTEVENDSQIEEHDETLNKKEDKSILLSALSNLKNIQETEVEKVPDHLETSDVIKLVEKASASKKKLNFNEKNTNYEELTKQIKDFLKRNPPKRPVSKYSL